MICTWKLHFLGASIRYPTVVSSVFDNSTAFHRDGRQLALLLFVEKSLRSGGLPMTAKLVAWALEWRFLITSWTSMWRGTETGCYDCDDVLPVTKKRNLMEYVRILIR
jgi:hypothetical protein